MGMEHFIIVGEKAQCKTCFVFFTPDSTDLPPQHKYEFCSKACEQKAIDEIHLDRIERQRIMGVAA